jgi:hypothetical protein
VLLDMLTVKTIVGFAQRPLVWFGFLSAPFILVGSISLVASLMPLITSDDTMSVSLAGTGVLLGAQGILLILGGAVGELIYSTGKFARLKRNVPAIVQRLDMTESIATDATIANSVQVN